MESIEKQKLEIRLNFIFHFYSQQELSEILLISQCKLLEKMTDNSFNENELLSIEKICNKLTN